MAQVGIESANVGQPTSHEDQHLTNVAVGDLTHQLTSTSLDDCNPRNDGDEDCSQELRTVDTDDNIEGVDVRSEVRKSGPIEPLEVELSQAQEEPSDPTSYPTHGSSHTPIYDDPSDDDDNEGEWITSSNITIHKSRALNLLPHDGLKGKRKEETPIRSGCMTADFAMQNVLLQMGLNLIGLEGKRIEKIKSWVLRCHACFKYESFLFVSLIFTIIPRICKDNSKKFCPSCGNPTLLRASVTVAAPGASPNTQTMQVHLKRNFQYKLRGTKYSIPAPKPGSAKAGSGSGLILREDQVEYIRAKKKADGKREREEQKLLKGILSQELHGKAGNLGVSSWMDPDWIPEMISVGAGGKGRTMKSSKMDGDMPQIGYGRQNPNERRRKK